jgi:hypothetical protein
MADTTLIITMANKTCQCGAVYCIPNWVTSFRCPICSLREMLRLEEVVSRRWDEIKHLEKVNSGLRGTITRMKKAR